MRKVELTKYMKLEVPENIKSILDGDQLEKCFDTLIRHYYRASQHADAELLEKTKNAIFSIPDIYLYKED